MDNRDNERVNLFGMNIPLLHNKKIREKKSSNRYKGIFLIDNVLLLPLLVDVSGCTGGDT